MLRLISGKWPEQSADGLQPTTSNIDMKILYSSDHFIVVDKRYDLKVNSDDQDDKVTVSIELGNLYPSLVDKHAAHGFR